MSSTTPQMTRAEIFAHNSQNQNGVSFVLPRVFPNWTWKMIKQVFIDCGWGFVERVDVVPAGRIPKGRFKTAFVHFRKGSYNMRDRQAREVLEKLSKGPENFIELTYDEPWFWKVYISSAVRPDEAPKPKPRPAVKMCSEEKTSEPTQFTLQSPPRGNRSHSSSDEFVTTPPQSPHAAYSPHSPSPMDTMSYDRSAQNDEELRDAI